MLSGEAVDELKASFTNLLGQVILQDELDFRTGQLTKEFVFDDLAAGIYIFQLKSGNGSLYKKIMVK
ncbi:MAG TPA: T9SS type A sorting domain-containing protein [Bacteroidetes bacterium]|nr:T9SS type A sorting domain-containing protein [Bacteroidota bacterium]